MKNLLLAALIAVLGVSCAKRVQISPEKSNVNKGGIEASANWLKDKGKKFDIQFAITNNSEKDAIIHLHDISCAKGALQGQIKHTFFNTGERKIDLHRGEKKMFNFVCNYGSKTEGDYKVSIKRVYDNPTGDGVNTGKGMAENINWVQAADE